MRGTLVCAVTDGEESAEALALGAKLSGRLGLRLVLAHAVEGIDGIGGGDGAESVTMKADRQGAERRLARLADEHGVADRARRSESLSASRRRCWGRSPRRRLPT